MTTILAADKGVRLTLAEVLEDVKAGSRYQLALLFGEVALYSTLEEVLKDYKQSTG